MTHAGGIAASALRADTTAIDTVAQNISNAQTPGYVEETPVLSAVPGQTGVGAGVEVTSVAQAANALLSSNAWQSQAAVANLSTLQQVLTSVDNLFPIGAPTVTGSGASGGIAQELSTFWNSWDTLAQSPSQSAAREQVVDAATTLTESLGQASAQLAQLATTAGQQLDAQVAQVTTLLGQVATINQSITDAGSPDAANQQENQLRQVLGTLSQLAGVTARMQQDGTATISIGGVTVVQASNASSLSVTTTGTPKHTAVVLATDPSVAVPVSGGSTAGLLSALNHYLPTFSASLDAVAKTLATSVNAQLAAGYTATGASGATHPLFTGTTAASISVSAAIAGDPALLAVSASATPARAANNGANAQALAELGTALAGPDAAYRSMVQTIGTDTQNTNSQLSVATALSTQSQAALQSATGVDVTEQLTQLIADQQAYEATAKLLTIVDTTFQTLIGAFS